MKERPIIFSGPMIGAILDGRKTMTRRVCKQAKSHTWAGAVHPDGSGNGWVAWWPGTVSAEETKLRYPGNEGFRCPYGTVGDMLWCRETWAQESIGGGLTDMDPEEPVIRYRADGERCCTKWKPSIHMPRWASRITLEITGVKVERLKEITDEDAIAEGLEQSQHTGRWLPGPCEYPAWAFEILWDRINGKKHPWSSNPWVWVIGFKKVEA